MNQTITDLWYGSFRPFEHYCDHNGERLQLFSLMEHNRQELWDGLTEKQRTTLEKYIACTDDYLCRMQELNFCEGFSLGSKLTAEALVSR